MKDLRAMRNTVPGLFAFSRSRGFQALLRSWRRRQAVEESVRFALCELLGRRNRVGTYMLRGSSSSIVLRHRSRDTEIVDEIFVEPLAYSPPAGAAALLEKPGLRVLDLGGNVGLFAAFVLDRYDVACVTSFEPDPDNLALLRHCRDRNPHAPWQIIDACAGTRRAELQFVAGRHADSRVAATVTGGTVAVQALDVFPYIGEADFVKIDIEGGEWDLFADDRFASIRPAVIVVEWHARDCPFADPHESAVQVLRRAGYAVEGHDHGYPSGTVWGYRPQSAK